MRFIKNAANNRVFPWTAALAAKDGMIECDEVGNPKINNVPVGDGKMLQMLEEKASEANALRKENAILKKKIEQLERIHGKIDQQLPQKSLHEVVKEAEAKGELVTNEPIKEDVPEDKQPDTLPPSSEYVNMTNAQLLSEIRKKGLTRPNKINKDNLIAVLTAEDDGEE